MTLGSLSGTPDYSVSTIPPSGPINAGQQANFPVSATPTNGFDQAVTWSCMVVPAGPGCTVSPSPMPLDGSQTGTATVTFTTMARTMMTPPLVLRREVPQAYRWENSAALVASLVALLALFSLSRAPRQRTGIATAAGVLAVSLCVYSCGGYGTPGGQGQRHQQSRRSRSTR
jgi:hypothetical protein